MKTDYRHQEILLFVNTHFSSREWLAKKMLKEAHVLSPKQQLAQACWNGLLPDVLPEFFDTLCDKSIVLWEVNEAESFIDLEYGEFVRHPEKHFSINPYVFMTYQGNN